MARIRSIHPSLFTDEAWVSCSPLARILFLGLETDADDQGVFEWKPLQLKMRLLPGDAADVATMLAEIEAAGLIRQFEANGKRYGAIRNFRKHQKPQKPNALHPLPPDIAPYVALSARGPEPVADHYDTGTGIADPMEVGEGGEKDNTQGSSAEAVEQPPRADDWPTGDLQSYRQALIDLAGPGLGDPAKEPGLFTTIAEISRWRAMGCSWSLDVTPTVIGKTQKPRQSPVRTWSVLTPDVLAAKARREAEVDAPTYTPGSTGPPPSTAGQRTSAMREEGNRRFLESLEAKS